MINKFINCTNHSSTMWGEKQKACALDIGEITDYGFPNVLPTLKEKEIERLALKVVGDLIKMQPKAVLCQGEFTLTYAIINGLKRAGIRVVSACSERIVKEEIDEEGLQKKISYFQFVQFREY
ncbi:MAG: hypothetical protein R3Y24_05335 [Eubacteriales bacterium]